MFSHAEIGVLRAVHRLEMPTRSAIAQAAGLSTVSVTSLLSGLLARGLVARAGKAPSTGGRPCVIYGPGPRIGYTIGLFLEAGVCYLVAIDASGAVLLEQRAPLALSEAPGDRGTEIANGISAQVSRLQADPTLQGRRLLAVGVTPPGMVDTRRGLWLHGLRLSGVEHLRLGTLLEEALGVPVLVEDGARCLAHLALTRLGRDQAGDLLLVYLGSGVGAGLAMDGELFRGHRGLAGEIGHLIVEERGERCGCGNSGCLETVASVPAVLRRFQRLLDEGVISRLQEKELTLERIGEAAACGDRLALNGLAQIGASLGEACGKSILLFNPHTLLISGPVASLGDYLRDALWARVRQQVIPEMLEDLSLQFLPSRPGDEGMGAASLASQWFWDRRASDGRVPELEEVLS